MAKYIVIALACGGLGNRVFRAGDEAKSGDFQNPEELVKKGFLKEIEGDEPEGLDHSQPLPEYADITSAEIKERMEFLGIEIPSSVKSKKELYQFAIDSEKIEEVEENEETTNPLEKVVTQEDLDMNPELAMKGVKVGDTITIEVDSEEL